MRNCIKKINLDSSRFITIAIKPNGPLLNKKVKERQSIYGTFPTKEKTFVRMEKSKRAIKTLPRAPKHKTSILPALPACPAQTKPVEKSLSDDHKMHQKCGRAER